MGIISTAIMNCGFPVIFFCKAKDFHILFNAILVTLCIVLCFTENSEGQESKFGDPWVCR